MFFEAWRYWESQGLVQCKFQTEGDDAIFDVEFISLRDLYIQNNYAAKHRARRSQQEPQNAFQARNAAFKRLMQAVEKIVGPMSPAERRSLGDFLDYYYTDHNILLRAFEYTYKVQKRRNFKAVEALLKKWVDHNYTTIDAVNAAIEAESARFGVYREVLRLLGVYTTPNEGQKQLIDKWVDQYGFEPEALYPILVEITKKTTKPNFNYLDKHFETLSNEGIHTYDAFTNRTVAAAPSKPSSKTARRKQYTIERDRIYSDEELEALLLHKDDPTSK